MFELDYMESLLLPSFVIFLAAIVAFVFGLSKVYGAKK